MRISTAFRIACGLFALLPWVGAPVAAQCGGHEKEKLVPASGASGDLFGERIDLQWPLAVIGALGDSGAGSGAGAAHVYRRTGSFWDVAVLRASDGDAHDGFGVVAVDGDLVVVGAAGDESGTGAVYVFRYDGSRWVEEQKLTARDSEVGAHFGSSVSVDGEWVLVGAPLDDHGQTDCGAAYLFRYEKGKWVETQKLGAADNDASDRFGNSVCLRGDLALIGANGDAEAGGAFSGAAYVFAYDSFGDHWRSHGKLIASDGAAGDSFGESVAIAGDLALIGAPNDDDLGAESGSAYVFRENTGVWTEERKLLASDGSDGATFGRSVALSGATALVGAGFAEHAGSSPGAAYLIRLREGTWVEEQKLLASDGAHLDFLGRSVALDGTRALIGAPWSDPLGDASGSAYLFQVTEIALDIEPDAPSAGDRLFLTTCGGLPGGVVLLALVNVNGIPLFQSIRLGSFHTDGTWQLTATVPSGLAGLQLTFQSFGFVTPTRLAFSNRELVNFQ